MNQSPITLGQYGALHVFVDAVHHCPGTCTGCALSSSERRERLAPIEDSWLERVFGMIAAHARDTHAPSIAMVYGIGDYLRYDTVSVHRLVQRSVDMVADLHGDGSQQSVVMVSSSLIGKEHHIQQAIEDIFAPLRKPDYISAVLKVVFDPLKYRHADYGTIYARTFATVGRLVPDSDVVINLSPEAVAAIDPVSAYDMMADFGFRELELPWLLTKHQSVPCRDDLESLADWLIILLQHAEKDGRVYLTLHELRQHWQKWQGDVANDIRHTAPTGIHTALRQYLRFDEHGKRWPDFPHTGNACYGPRYGISVPGWHPDQPLEQSPEPIISSRIIRDHLRHAACRACPHLAVCATTGFHITNHGLAARNALADGDCPNVVAKRLFDYFASC